MSSTRVGALLALVCLFACQKADGPGSVPGGGDAPSTLATAGSPLDPHSGTRLKARWQVSDDGARVFTGWGSWCNFTARQGDTYVCGSPTDYVRPDGVSLFADPDCTRPVISQHATTQNPTFLLLLPNHCPLEAGLFQPDPAAPALEHVYQGDGVRCWERTDLPGESVYTAAKEVRAELVSARAVMGAAKDGWAPVMLEGEDGARQFLAWHNVAEGYDCQFGITADGVMRCLPGEASVGDLNVARFADAACQVPAAVNFISSCTRAAYVAASPSATCSRGGEIHRGGDRIPDAHGKDQHDACVEAPPRNVAAFAVGPAVPPETFPAVKYATAAGRGRLRALYVVGMPEPTPVVGQFWDTTLQTRCQASGSQCEPTPAPIVTGDFYADPACQQELISEDASCPTTEAFGLRNPFSSSSSAGEPPGLSGYYRLGAAHHGQIFQREGGACVAAELSDGQSFRRADRVPLSSLATVADIVDP